MVKAKENIFILKSKNNFICTKRFCLNDGKFTKLPFRFSSLFDVEVNLVSSLKDLSLLLKLLEDDPTRFIIRGQLIDGIPTENIRRKGKSNVWNDRNSNFNPTSRQWCLIDIDDLDLPSQFEDIANKQQEIVGYTISNLPKEFQEVDCHYQFSSSMGITPGKIKMHLWYWLERKVSDAEMKAWLGKSKTVVDLSLYRPVQPHFTARPIFTDGAVDPLPNRSGLFKVNKGKDTVRVPSNLKELIEKPFLIQRASYVRSDGFIESQEIIRDTETGLAIDGREKLLFSLSLQVIRDWAKGKKAKDVPDLVELTQLLWQEFMQEADLLDGKWKLQDANNKMAARISDYQSGTYTFTSRADNTILYPNIEPFFPINTMDKKEGEIRLNKALFEFFKGIENDRLPRLALRVTMGAGKTRQTIKHLKDYLKTSYANNIEIYVPRHEIANEYVEYLNGDEPVNARLIHIYGRGGKEENNILALCKRYQYVRQLEIAGISIFQNACYASQEDMCEHFNTCEYINQFRVGDEFEQMQNTIRIFQHTSLSLPRNRLEQLPDIVIIDEAFLNTCLKKEEINPELIRTEFNHPDYPKLGNQIVDSFHEGKSTLTTLKKIGITHAIIAELNFERLRPNIEFNSSSKHQIRLRSSIEYDNLNKMQQILLEEIRLDGRDNVTRLLYDDFNKKIVITFFNEPRIPDTASLLLLDATADEVLLKKAIGDIDFKRIDIEQKAVVTQVFDRTGSKHSWDKGGQDVNNLVTILNEWSSFGEKVLCVSHKTLAQKLSDNSKLSKEVILSYFGNIRGSNSAKDCTVIFITGRNAPPPSEVDIKARGLFWDEKNPLSVDDGSRINNSDYRNNRLPLSIRGYSFKDINNKMGVGVYAFSDERTDKLHQQICEAETIQAIARLRLVHTPVTKRVFLLSNLPVEIPIDNVISFADLMPDKLEYELLKYGNLPITQLGLQIMRPDIATSVKVAEKLLSRSKFNKPLKLTIDKFGQTFPTLHRASICIVTFSAQHNSRTHEHRHLFMLPNQKTLEHDISVSTGKLPIDEWIHYLEHGDKHIEGSGWGAIKMQNIQYVPLSLLPQ